jgi:hypothetical protein
MASTRLSGNSRAPESGVSLKNWNRMRASSCRATKVPRPWRRTTRFSAVISSSALRTVPALTPRSSAISGSLGRSWPGLPHAVGDALHEDVPDLAVEGAEAEPPDGPRQAGMTVRHRTTPFPSPHAHGG